MTTIPSSSLWLMQEKLLYNRIMKLSLHVILISLVATVLWTESFLAHRNVLAFKKDWQIAQEGFINPGLNVLPSLLYRKLLTGYRLSSDHLMGVQRIISKEDIQPLEVKTWFRLGKSSYVDMIVNGNSQTYTGIRLSSSSVYPSMIYEADHNGKYVSQNKLDFHMRSGFHTVVMKEGNIIANGKELKLPSGLLRSGRVGVQVGIQESDLYGMEAKSQTHNLTLHFFPEGNRLGIYLRHFLIIAGIVFIAGVARQKSAALIITGLGFLFFGYSTLIKPQNESIDSALVKFKVMDFWWRPEGHLTLEEKSDELHKNRVFSGIIHCKKDGCKHLAPGEMPGPKTGKRVVIFGGSQSMPSLVTDVSQSFHYLFDKNLRKDNPEIETISVTSLGLFSERLSHHEKILEKLDIDDLILENRSFASELELIKSFMKKWHEKGVRIIYLRPPVNPARIREDIAQQVISELRMGIEANGPAVRDPGSPEILRTIPFFQVAAREIPFIFLDPNPMLLDQEIMFSGEIFWDGFHFTGWGQKLYADWLAGEYLKIEVKR